MLIKFPEENWTGTLEVSASTLFSQIIFHTAGKTGHQSEILEFFFKNTVIEKSKYFDSLENLGIFKNLRAPVIAKIKQQEKKKSSILKNLIQVVSVEGAMEEKSDEKESEMGLKSLNFSSLIGLMTRNGKTFTCLWIVFVLHNQREISGNYEDRYKG